MIIHLNNTRQSQIGFTLIELLLAMLLSTIILTSVIAFFINNQQNRLMVEKQLSQQERQRFIAYFLTHSLQSACYAGCVALDERAPFINHTDDSELALSSQNCIKIFSATDSQLPPFLQHKVLIGSNVLSMRQADVNSVALKQPAMAGDEKLIIDDSVLFKVGEGLLIADCQHGEIFYVKAVSHDSVQANQILTLNASLHYSYQQQITLVSKLINRVFYIAVTGRTAHDGIMINGLYQQDYKGEQQELVDGITNLTASQNKRLINIAVLFNQQPYYITLPLRDVML